METTVSMLQPAGPLACDQIQMPLGHWLSQTNSGLALGQEMARDRHGADAFMRSWQLGFGSEKPSRRVMGAIMEGRWVFLASLSADGRGHDAW